MCVPDVWRVCPSQPGAPCIESQKLKWLDYPLKEHEAFAQSSEKDCPQGHSATWMRQGQGRMLWAPEPNPQAFPTHLNTQHTIQPPPQILTSLQSLTAVLAVGSRNHNPQHISMPPTSQSHPSPGGALGPLQPWASGNISRQGGDEEGGVTEGAAPLPGLLLPLTPRHTPWQPSGTGGEEGPDQARHPEVWVALDEAHDSPSPL